MSVESVTQAVSDMALAFSDQDDEIYAMVCATFLLFFQNAMSINEMLFYGLE